MGTFGEPADTVPVTGDERFLLCAGPPFDPPLEGQRLIPRWNGLAPDEFDGSPAARPITADALLVLPQTRFHVFGMTSVIGAVSAAQ
jgi:hypothetical protein